MRMRQPAFGVIAMTVAACALTLPPDRVAESDFRSLAGTYTGGLSSPHTLEADAAARRRAREVEALFESYASTPG